MKSLGNKLAFLRSTEPWAKCFVQKIHLHPRTFCEEEGGTSCYVLVWSRAWNSACKVRRQLVYFKASVTKVGSRGIKSTVVAWARGGDHGIVPSVCTLGQRVLVGYLGGGGILGEGKAVGDGDGEDSGRAEHGGDSVEALGTKWEEKGRQRDKRR